MDFSQEDDAQRLAMAAALLGVARRCCGRRIAPESDAAALLALASALHQGVAPIAQAQQFQFEPAYPGATVGPEAIGTTCRLVFAAHAAVGNHELGVVFTTLIAGHPPRVSIAPVGTAIAQGWSPLA